MSDRDVMAEIRRLNEENRAKRGRALTHDEIWSGIQQIIDEGRRKDVVPGETPEQQIERRRAKAWALIHELAEKNARRRKAELDADRNDD